MSSITSANAIVTLTIPGLFNVPVQLQGFSADNIYDSDVQTIVETSMGLDGFLSGGFTFTPVNQSFTLQADSASNTIFETWAAQQRAAKDVYVANGQTTLPSVGKSYIQTRGFLISWPPMPSAGKTLTARKYAIQWQSSQPVPV